MKWRAFSRMPQWVRLSEWLGIGFGLRNFDVGDLRVTLRIICNCCHLDVLHCLVEGRGLEPMCVNKYLGTAPQMRLVFDCGKKTATNPLVSVRLLHPKIDNVSTTAPSVAAYCRNNLI